MKPKAHLHVSGEEPGPAPFGRLEQETQVVAPPTVVCIHPQAEQSAVDEVEVHTAQFELVVDQTYPERHEH